MTSATVRRVGGLVAICTGGYAILGSTGGFTRTLAEAVLFGLGLATMLYGMVLLAERGERHSAWNPNVFLVLAGLLVVNQLVYDPTPAFADGEMWADTLGTQTGMYVLSGVLGVVGLVSGWYELESSTGRPKHHRPRR